MKRCPTCTRTFLDEQLTYCTDDGTPLVDQPQSSSFDPGATVLAPSPQTTNDASGSEPTRPFRPDEMPGGWPTPHAWAQSDPLPPPPAAPVWSPQSTPGAGWAPPPPPQGQYAKSKSQQNPIAIASMALGIFSMTIGLCCYLGMGTGPIAIILGVIALAQVKNDVAQSGSKGMAIAGIATGAAALGIIFLLFVLGIATGSWR